MSRTHIQNFGETTSTSQSEMYANRSARFIDAYAKGLSRPKAVWANGKYQTLPPAIAADLKDSYQQYLAKLEALNRPIPPK